MSDTKRSTNVDVPRLELIQDSPDSSDEEKETVMPMESRSEHENVGVVNQNDRDISPESGIDLESRGDTGITEKETTLAESTDRPVLPPNQMFNFDLTNPEEVVKMLESVNLTDEDTDVLLQEAYNVNMKLKEILRRKEKSGGSLNPSDTAAIKGANVVVVSGPSMASASNSRANSATKRSQFSKTAPLPPISNGPSPSSNMRVPSAVYSAKLNRPVPPSANYKRTALSSQDKRIGSRNPSASTMHKPPKSSKKPVPVSTCERPEWNDRFMY